jgi:hypothetical protein
MRAGNEVLNIKVHGSWFMGSGIGDLFGGEED